MAKDVQLKAAVISNKGRFIVGDATPNILSVTMTNEGQQPTPKLSKGQFFYLDSLLGSDANALFLKETDAKEGVIEIELQDEWRSEWGFDTNDGKNVRLKLFPPQSFVLKMNESLQIVKLSNVISKTAPGNALLTFGSNFSTETVELTIPKIADEPDIISFTSTPAEGVFNLPDDVVTLAWRTYKLEKCELTLKGSTNPLYKGRLEDKETMMIEGTKQITCGTSNLIYTLRGSDGANRFERTLNVEILSDGWHSGRVNKLFKGDPGDPAPDTEAPVYPIRLQPTVLFNANNNELYGVFWHDYQNRKRALLFRTRNPFGDWQLVESAVLNRSDLSIPDEHATSPGVYADGKLWLVGGSLVDPDITSNEVWYFELESKLWKCLDNAPPDRLPLPRMGHAALKYGNEIWIMGGRDEAGNALNDVWALDLKSLSWRSVGEAPWSPRCCFNPTVFKEQIWLYGGAEEPFAEKLYNDLWVYDGAQWREKKSQVFKDAGGESPIAAGLQVFQDRLHLIGQFRKQAADTSEEISTLEFSLISDTTNVWNNLNLGKLFDWRADTTFNLQLLNFKDRMLIVKALAYEPIKADLQIYVSSV